jgi:hypothetical protein
MSLERIHVCKRCSTEFATPNTRRLYCGDCQPKRSKRNPSRSLQRSHNELRFVGVDGEGVDRPDGNHEYVMLSVGNQTLWADGRQLTIGEILSFLWECYTSDPEACYVGFFLGYDFIQWEKLLPEAIAYSLLTNQGIAARKSQVHSRANPYPDAVVVSTSSGLWEIDIMAGRRWKLRPHIHHRSAYNSACRNRTCDFNYEEVIVHDFPEPVKGELEWRNPGDDGRYWDGDSRSFWEAFIPVRHNAGSDGVQQRVSGWLYICDTGPFWQTGFLNVINPKGWTDPVCSEDEYDIVIRGKADRGLVADYDETSYYEEMARYNTLENDILSRVTQRLNEGFMNDAIPIALKRTDWYGPGRAAQTWMDMLHARIGDPQAIRSNRAHGPTLSGERQNEYGLLNADAYLSMPSWFYDAAQASYYGGWFEQMVHGHVGDVWEYDINSAYPFIISTLPCLHTENGHTGSYTSGEGSGYPTHGNRYTLVYADITGSNPYIGCMPYRDRQGRISRPHHVKGWYWLHEVDAAIRAGLIDTVSTEKWVSYKACACTPPFDPDDIGITRMYLQRLAMGKNSPGGKALKLVYNSAYGKTAQSIGAPKYANPVYASLITAGCRTLILDAIATHPQRATGVTMVATDGIYFTSPHPNLPLDKQRLGAWDETVKPNLTQLMPGVYWDDGTRESIGLGGTPKLKSRGVNAKDLAKQIDNLDFEFALFADKVGKGIEVEWPSITFHVDFLLDSAKLALQRGKWETAGRVQHGTTRKISSDPITKRLNTPYREPDSGLIRTRPYASPITVESTPYSKAFGYPDSTGLMVDRDGTDGMQYFRDLLKR